MNTRRKKYKLAGTARLRSIKSKTAFETPSCLCQAPIQIQTIISSMVLRSLRAKKLPPEDNGEKSQFTPCFGPQIQWENDECDLAEVFKEFAILSKKTATMLASENSKCVQSWGQVRILAFCSLIMHSRKSFRSGYLALESHE
jgi:hypothetical protein